MWGCTGIIWTVVLIMVMVPTHVGVYQGNSGLRFPKNIWSPRMWGCTADNRILEYHPLMVPTHVGVYRKRRNI